jgi:NtrC-family two-component system response regulator AlgB
MTTTPQVGDLVSLEKLEIAHIKAVLDKSDTLDDAAETLGIDIATLYRKRVRYKMPLAFSREFHRGPRV